MLLIFTIAMFSSAVLLFLVQPMFAKMVLPLLGGTPAVWNTCMVFYQAALLAGYGYAHVATRWFGVRRQAALHLVLLLVIVLTLPIGVARGWMPPVDRNPIAWLLALLAVSVGLPFFVVSTTAPMLQKWFAHTGHAAARDPYFLYGASNLGSMVALLAYPLLVEPHLPLAGQARFWAGGYGLLVGLIVVCAVLLWRSPPAAALGWASESGEFSGASSAGDNLGAPTAVQRLWWVLLAFAPSSLLLGVTTYLSTDVASVPLLWVVPLAIYLLTFVLVFARKPILPHRLMVFIEPFLIIPIAFLFALGLKNRGMIDFPLHLLAFFIIAMVCHGELVKYRPGTSHLTEFYLWMSLGGVLGGLFNALVAPVTFNAVIEYPLIIAVASMLRPGQAGAEGKPFRRWLDILLPLALLVLLAVPLGLLPQDKSKLQLIGTLALAGLVGMLCYSFRFRSLRFGLGVGAIILAGTFANSSDKTLYRERNFYGVFQVRQDSSGHYHSLIHGTTMHGIQSFDRARQGEPLSYYSRTGPLGQVFAAFSQQDAGWRIAAVGLGTGSIASYGRPGQHLTFYEIDPAVARIARDRRYFTYLQDCRAQVDVVLGDARLSLQKAPDGAYDLMVLDAFSSDAIPIHLVTREALRLYLSKLKNGGILLFHLSNQYLDLRPVLANLARDGGLTCLIETDMNLSDEEKRAGKTGSVWAAMVRRPADLGILAKDTRWQPFPGQAGGVLWTDTFSNIVAVVKWGSLFK